MIQVGIYVYPEVEVLDFAGPYEVFSTASRLAARVAPVAAPLFGVALVAEAAGPVAARAGLRVVPHHAFDDCPPLDLLVVPGGVHGPELERPRVMAWIAERSRAARVTASVCTGAFLLARAGVITRERVTTHWEDCDDLRSAFPSLVVEEAVRWVEHERVVTSAGISAGIDMSLRLVARLASQELAERTARQMEYDWRKRA